MRMMRWLTSPLLVLLCLSASASEREPGRGVSPDPLPPLPEGVTLSALITDARLTEISGLAVSRRHRGIVWVHNDSHDANVVHAVDTDGKVRATLDLPVPNIDWEDIAVFAHDGRFFLLLADTGDNGGLREELALHVFEEPGTLADARIEQVRTIRFRWPDGARDCEAVAVDARDGDVWLVSKKRVPPELFRVPLFPANPDEMQVAEKRGALAGIAQATAQELQRNPVYGKYRNQVTAADISADGEQFAVMTYLHLYRWTRHPDGWAAALSRPPGRLDLPWMAQAEAMGFDASGGTLWIGTERLPAPLLRFRVPDPAPSP
ncbi:hypothetical protein OS176_05095 [Xanthomonadaceae bacterium XH05]|nr:hypothetical protein [Xanthomonadaceae bacterium XH05]